jgi:hypothetical protein
MSDFDEPTLVEWWGVFRFPCRGGQLAVTAISVPGGCSASDSIFPIPSVVSGMDHVAGDEQVGKLVVGRESFHLGVVASLDLFHSRTEAVGLGQGGCQPAAFIAAAMCTPKGEDEIDDIEEVEH